MRKGYLLPWMDQRFIQRHFNLKLQGIHRSCSSKIYYWHHQLGGAINCYYQMKIIKPLSGICSVGLGEPERGRKSIKSSADGYNHISSANSLFHLHMHISICSGSIRAMYHPYGYMQYKRTILYRLRSTIYLLSYSSSTSDILSSSASQHDENTYMVRVGHLGENQEFTLTLSASSFFLISALHLLLLFLSLHISTIVSSMALLS